MMLLPLIIVSLCELDIHKQNNKKLINKLDKQKRGELDNEKLELFLVRKCFCVRTREEILVLFFTVSLLVVELLVVLSFSKIRRY